MTTTGWNTPLRRPFDVLRTLPTMRPDYERIDGRRMFTGRHQDAPYSLEIAPCDTPLITVENADPVTVDMFGFSLGPRVGRSTPWPLLKRLSDYCVATWESGYELDVVADLNIGEHIDRLEKAASIVDGDFQIEPGTLLFDTMVYLMDTIGSNQGSRLTLQDPLVLEINGESFDLSDTLLTLAKFNADPTLALTFHHEGGLACVEPYQLRVGPVSQHQRLQSLGHVYQQLTVPELAELNSIVRPMG